jgi:HSP20 family protein
MIRRIRPVSKVLRVETEIERSGDSSCGPRLDITEWAHVWTPAVDISEREEEIVVEVELPGVLEKDVRITLHGTRIEVRGLKRENPPEGGLRFHRLEREYGRFRRMILVPCAVVPEKTRATLENGILTIFLEKNPRKSREIEVVIKIGRAHV